MANHEDVLARARHKGKREVEALVASLRPLPSVPSTIRKLPDPRQVPLDKKPVIVTSTTVAPCPPLTIPAIVLVVGLAPVYAWVNYFLGGSSITLVFAYTILVFPYAYRAIDAGLSAIDVKTLAEAARSLGASWATVMWRVVLPNIRSAVLSAAFLTVALVLGEFTIASLLNRTNLQVAINFLGKSSATMSVAVSLAALLLAFVLLMLLSLFGGRRRAGVVEVATPAPAVPLTKEPS